MPNVWFISDTHFFHDNILKFHGAGRPFASIEEMNETIVQKWNAVVKPADVVHHLGDVSFKLFQKEDEVDKLLSRLMGQKHLYMGNHDTLPSILSKHFCKINLWKVFAKYNFVASHVPIPTRQFRNVTCQVHGHTHVNKMDDPHYINVCVEHTDFAPVHIEDIWAQTRKLI